jgi:cation diffusion facilitator family transporter
MTNIKEQAAFNSILASAGLAIGKFVAAFMTGSLGLLSDALHALLDVGATILTYFAVRIGAKPADDKHPYGHGKIEAVAALIETGLLFVVAVYVGVEALGRLRAGSHELPLSLIAYSVLIISIVVDVVRSRSLLRIAKQTKSEALAADALHFSSDLVSSALVLLGLIAANFGYSQGDSLAAIGVAVFISIAGYRLGQRTIDTLMDAVPAGLSEKIRQTSQNVGGVVSVDTVRVRAVGNEIFAELTIGVARTLSLDRVATIKSNVIAAVKAEYPSASVTVTTTPRTLDDETVLERILHIAAVMRRPVHHVTIQRIDDRLSVSLDLEVDGRLSLEEGHAITFELEAEIARELGANTEVEIHLEPLEIQALEGTDLAGQELIRISDVLNLKAEETAAISDVHDVRVRRTEAGLVLNYHCFVDPQFSIVDVHNHVDALERAVRQEIPEIIRAVGHAEPRPVQRLPA